MEKLIHTLGIAGIMLCRISHVFHSSQYVTLSLPGVQLDPSVEPSQRTDLDTACRPSRIARHCRCRKPSSEWI